jgi:CheY-like chemotaxis protein
MAHILLVDDDADLVARNAAALEADGHAVATASTTAEGLDAVRHGAPDVVVLEAMLDGAMAGFDLARTLARDFPTLPLIRLASSALGRARSRRTHPTARAGALAFRPGNEGPQGPGCPDYRLSRSARAVACSETRPTS